MKSLCTYKYHNEKSRHHGKDVPMGMLMKKNVKLKKWDKYVTTSFQCAEHWYKGP
jgi:hypothetical protein